MRFARSLAAAALCVLAACTPPATTQTPSTGPAPQPGPPGPPAPPADPAAVAAELQRATAPASPRQVNFAWQLDEAGARFNGRGVARFVAPTRFRLDLFGPRGETYLAAALVDGQPRVPAALAGRFSLPSPALLWGAVGVVAPPVEARLLETAVDNGVTTLRYQLGEDVLEYRARGGRLESVRRRSRGGVAESIDLDYNDQGLARAQYRDWAAYRTLNLTPESSTDVQSFPDATWTPPGT